MEIARGLRGVVLTETRLSKIAGDEGRLTIAGFALADLAPNAGFEEVLYLLWNDRLPKRDELAGLRDELAASRALPAATMDLLRAAAAQRVAPMDALRTAVATLMLDLPAGERDDLAAQKRLAPRLVAKFPTIVATYRRLLDGLEPVGPNPDLSYAADFLAMTTGEDPTPAKVRGLDTYLATVVDHGMNASTFTARVVAATESDLLSALVGAIGALKGPRHGGAPGPALDMVFEIRDRARAAGTELEAEAERWGREALGGGKRLMGFGHRVYRVRDPRADVLADAAAALVESEEERAFGRDVRTIEEVMLRLLEEHKPGRSIKTNVEFYTALLLHGLGFEPLHFPAVFAAGRVGGWVGHVLEQYEEDELIRPSSGYRGAEGRRWTRIEER